MFKVHVNTGAIQEFQAKKEIAKLEARSLLKTKSEFEYGRSSDPWYRTRFDWQTAQKNAKQYQKDYERTAPETLTPQAESYLWKRAKQLKDEFVLGMLSREEVHPVKQFESNGAISAVVDEARLQANNSTAREMAWQKKNEQKIVEFKNIMRHLEPDNPNAGDIERFRPKLRGIR